MILIISSPQDPHAVAVIQRLDARGVPYFLCDTAQFPRDLGLSVEHTDGAPGLSLTEICDSRTVDLGAVKVAWWRRPPPLLVHEEIKAP
jgi:hypothetical protein